MGDIVQILIILVVLFSIGKFFTGLLKFVIVIVLSICLISYIAPVEFKNFTKVVKESAKEKTKEIIWKQLTGGF